MSFSSISNVICQSQKNNFVVNFGAIYVVVKSGVCQLRWSCVLTRVASFRVVGVAWKMLNYRHPIVWWFPSENLSCVPLEVKRCFLVILLCWNSANRLCPQLSVHWSGEGGQNGGSGRGEGKPRSLNSLQTLGADSFRKLDLASQLDYFWLVQLIFEVYFYLLLISTKLKARMVSSWGTVNATVRNAPADSTQYY